MKFLVALALLTVQAFATDFEQSGRRLAAVEVNSGATRGSGVLVTPTRVLTAAHVISNGQVVVTINDKRVPAIVVKQNRTMDVALLALDEPSDVKPVRLGHKRPKPGSTVEVWGFGPSVFREFGGKVTKIPNSVDEPFLFGVRGEHGQTTVSGDSGGAVYQNGQIVGIHWGYRGKRKQAVVCVVDCASIREWANQ